MLALVSARVRSTMRPFAPDGLHGVAPEIQQRLDDEVPVEAHARKARIVVALDLHGAGRLGRQQMTNVLHQLVDVERLLAGLLSGTEQRIDEAREAIGLGDDDRSCTRAARGP